MSTTNLGTQTRWITMSKLQAPKRIYALSDPVGQTSEPVHARLHLDGLGGPSYLQPMNSFTSATNPFKCDTATPFDGSARKNAAP